MEEILIGTTDRTILVYIADPASTDGSGKTGLAHTDMTVSNTRVETDNDVINTDYTSSLNALTNLTDAHNDWGWKEVSATLAPGLYRLDVADALFATGAWYSVLSVAITTSLASVTPKAFKLVNLDMFGTPATNIATAGTNYSATRGLSGTALPAAAADAAGGLPISDAGGLDLDAQIGTDIDAILADTNELQTDWANGGRLDLLIDATLADTNELQTDWANGGRLDLLVDAILDDTGTSGVVVASIAAGAITAAAIANGAIDAATFAADVDAEILSYIVDDATRIDASSLNTATVTTIPAILVDTAEIGAAGAGLTAVPWNANWDAEVQSEVADALAATIPDSIPADGTRPSVNAALYMLCQGFFESGISGTTWTVNKVDGTTALFTVTLDDATTPTAKTRAT